MNNNFNIAEKARQYIITEQNKIETEIKLQAEKEAKIKKEQEDEKQVKVNFENWLTEQANNYSNNEKLNILKKIFLTETGRFSKASTKLLVLIDNFDNPICKEKILDWLSYYNTASLKVFFHITGINLGQTNKVIQSKLNSITSKDFQGIVSYMPKNKKNEKELETFYIYSYDNFNKKHDFQECKGEYLFKYDLDFFILKSNAEYVVVEATSGLNAGRGKTKQAAIENLAEGVNRVGFEMFKELIKNSIDKTGGSPKYRNDIAVS